MSMTWPYAERLNFLITWGVLRARNLGWQTRSVQYKRSKML